MDKPRLSFRADGTFHILQLTDMHLKGAAGRDATAFSLVRDIVARERPDLIALTGDISCDGNAWRMVRVMDALAGLLESLGVPYTYTLGNHESDGEHAGTGRQHALAAALEAYPLCLFERGAPELGVGNYAVPVFPHGGGDRPAWMLYHLDCHSGIDYVMGDGATARRDAYIRPEQLRWLEGAHRSLQERHGAVPSLLFDHVPLPEFDDVWMFDGVYGDRLEKVWHPPVNSGLFSLLYRLGDFRGVFAGHDHVNSFHGTMMGILLAYGRCSGYQTACEDYFKRGGRVIVVGEQSGRIEDTYIALHDGSAANAAFAPPLFDRFDYYLPGDALPN